MDQLQTYLLKIVNLGQETLAHHRQGQALPDELASLAQEALALENSLRFSGTFWTDDPAATPPPPLLIEDDVLVLDVEEEPGGGPVSVERPLDALPPLVVDVAGGKLPEEGPACRRCGTALRPGRRFCHRCGAPIETVTR